MSIAFASRPGQGWLAEHLPDYDRHGRPDPYSDRVCSATETVARLRPFLKQIGITRLADVTGLDHVGIPVWMAIRPNAATLSVSQGKGIDDDAARASALMESTELAFAERPVPGAIAAARQTLVEAGCAIIDTARFLRPDRSDYGDSEPRRWVEAADLIAERRVFVPEEIVGFARPAHDPAASPPYAQSSDGLASGNVLLEAVFHALCERIERDAMALWSYLSAAGIARRQVDPRRFDDPVVTDLARRITDAGLRLRLYDATSDIGVPTFFALIAPTGRAADLRYLEVASGSGSHPVPVRAALRAITEAAQTRLTTISGARDDFDPATYGERLATDLAVYLDGPDTAEGMLPEGRPPADIDAHLGWMLERLVACRVGSAIVVPLGGEEYGIAVAKVIVSDLEDKPGAVNRRPGRRAIRAMMRAR